jgi:6-phosphogluconolactonase
MITSILGSIKPFAIGLGFAAAVAAGAAPTAQAAGPGTIGAVFTASNDELGNQVIAFGRGPDGGLWGFGYYDTGGLGTSMGLGNQGGVIVDARSRRLFVVNAGSDDISAFSITRQGLVLTDIEPSMGELPVSLAYHDGLLYVLNAGGAGNIAGFTVSSTGDIVPVANSVRPLSGAAATGAAQISFTPDGGVLVVTEKATDMIDTFVVENDGTTTGPNVFASSGATPFGFDFSASGYLLVSEAFGAATGEAAVSSYDVAADGMLTLISASVPNGQTASCWLVTHPRVPLAFTTNTPAGTLSSYTINSMTGEILLLRASGVAYNTGPDTGPLDADFDRNGQFLYVLLSGSHEIAGFRVNPVNGALQLDSIVPYVPETANGMAAF